MQVNGAIVDNDDYSGLDGVSVGVVDNNGKYHGPGAVTNASGEFWLDNDLLTPYGSFFLLVTRVGYSPVMIDPTVFLNQFKYPLVKAPPEAFAEFVVTAKKNSGLLTWLVVGAALWYVCKKI